jgi:hypothetical protein
MTELGHNRPDLATDLEASFEDITARADELIDGLYNVPEVIEDEDTERRATDYVKQIREHQKKANGLRVAEKEPFLSAGRQVDGFFKGKIIDPLDKVAVSVLARLTEYKRAVEAQRRREREAAERKAREEAERQRQEAERAAEEMQDDADADAAVEAERAAERAEADAARAKKAAEAKAAELTRSRGDYGGVSSLVTTWAGELVDRAELDLEALRQHLPSAAIDQAIRSFVKAGGRELRGARIYEKTSTRVV